MLLSGADVELFAQVSGDANPLHGSAEHARATPFGGIVAHGVLALIAALDEARPRWSGVAVLDVEFRGPVRPGVDYRVELEAEALRVLDGSRVCLSAWWSTGPVADLCPTAVAPLAAAESRTTADLAPGVGVSGEYGPGGLPALEHRFPHATAALGRGTVLGLLWSSYLAGMRLPGEWCLLGGLSLRSRADEPGAPGARTKPADVAAHAPP
ncbi:MaoC/PaaZ C-terminal domain-containing protein, partial [Umezawaea sp. NPDC059074]|uniref:MaoC/PaaZ C-terminal domain-containing protein n=1 Tax=Umezawaea sp. NPDC059074 TaxID=3346716 RepID=UPI0036B6FC29